MQHDLENTIALLERFPAALNALLRDLPDAWTRGNEGEKTWSAFDTVVHLINTERTNWIPRAKALLEYGESRPFPGFKREADIAVSQTRPFPELLDEFAQLRGGNVAQLRELQLGEADLAKRGQHPVFGSVTLSELLAAWAAHDLNHLHQIARAIAHQYREAVGPYHRYLGVMHCDGHGAPA